MLVEVTRLPGRAYPPQILWLWWQGPGTPDLAVLWRAYVHRFDLEHTLHRKPRLRRPELRGQGGPSLGEREPPAHFGPPICGGCLVLEKAQLLARRCLLTAHLLS